MLSINISELIWAVICFFVLMFVLKKLLFEPVISFTEARRARIDEGLGMEREAKAALSAGQAENEAALDRSRAEAAKLIADTRAECESRHSESMKQAKLSYAADRRSMRTETAAELESEEKQLTAAGAELARALADRLTGIGE